MDIKEAMQWLEEAIEAYDNQVGCGEVLEAWDIIKNKLEELKG